MTRFPRKRLFLILCWFLTIFGILLFPSCSSPGQLSQSQTCTIVGKVYLTGNEPFTKLALEVPTGKTYILQCTGKIRGLLLTNQGKLVKLHVDRVLDVPEGEALNVVRAEFLLQEK